MHADLKQQHEGELQRHGARHCRHEDSHQRLADELQDTCRSTEQQALDAAHRERLLRRRLACCGRLLAGRMQDNCQQWTRGLLERVWQVWGQACRSARQDQRQQQHAKSLFAKAQDAQRSATDELGRRLDELRHDFAAAKQASQARMQATEDDLHGTRALWQAELQEAQLGLKAEADLAEQRWSSKLGASQQAVERLEQALRLEQQRRELDAKRLEDELHRTAKGLEERFHLRLETLEAEALARDRQRERDLAAQAASSTQQLGVVGARADELADRAERSQEELKRLREASEKDSARLGDELAQAAFALRAQLEQGDARTRQELLERLGQHAEEAADARSREAGRQDQVGAEIAQQLGEQLDQLGALKGDVASRCELLRSEHAQAQEQALARDSRVSEWLGALSAKSDELQGGLEEVGLGVRESAQKLRDQHRDLAKLQDEVGSHNSVHLDRLASVVLQMEESTTAAKTDLEEAYLHWEQVCARQYAEQRRATEVCAEACRADLTRQVEALSYKIDEAKTRVLEDCRARTAEAVRDVMAAHEALESQSRARVLRLEEQQRIVDERTAGMDGSMTRLREVVDAVDFKARQANDHLNLTQHDLAKKFEGATRTLREDLDGLNCHVSSVGTGQLAVRSMLRDTHDELASYRQDCEKILQRSVENLDAVRGMEGRLGSVCSKAVTPRAYALAQDATMNRAALRQRSAHRSAVDSSRGDWFFQERLEPALASPARPLSPTYRPAARGDVSSSSLRR